MSTSKPSISGYLIAVGVCLVLLFLTNRSTASAPAHASLDPAKAVSLRVAGTLSFPLMPAAAVPILGLVGTSVMPPLPSPGDACSVNQATGDCSALQANERCSALNKNNNGCSTWTPVGGAGNDQNCSAAADFAICSVLPPTQGNLPSFCSTLGNAHNDPECSAIGTGQKQQCSAKGFGDSICSAIGLGSSQERCSVLASSPQRSFCSTKSGQPGIAKSCSSWALDFNDTRWGCSVVLGEFGRCTVFGAASAGSCSAFTANSHCSVLFGPAGTLCSQP